MRVLGELLARRVGRSAAIHGRNHHGHPPFFFAKKWYTRNMNRQHISIIIAVAIVCLAAGYWLALPARKVLAPESGVPMDVISINDASSSQLYKVEGEYPQFGNASGSFNGAITDFVGSNLAQFKSDSEANQQARIATAPSGTSYELPPQSYYFSSSWEPEQINDNYISIIVRLDYFNGGANETQLLKTFNYDVTKGKIMTLADLFPGVPDYLQQISQLAIQELTSSLTNTAQQPLDASSQSMLQTGATPTADNYANFTFNDDVVNFYFPKYQVAPGVFGEQKVGIVRSTIK
jgi:hypothetical protein